MDEDGDVRAGDSLTARRINPALFFAFLALRLLHTRAWLVLQYINTMYRS